MILPFTLLTLLTIKDVQSAINVTPTTPVTFTQVGQIIYSGSHYVIPIQLSINDLLGMTEPLLIGLTETRKHFDTVVEHLAQRPRGTIDNSFPTSMQEHLTLLMSDLDTRIINLRGLLASLTNYGRKNIDEPIFRFKRSPFDFVGTGMSYLFGLVDHSQFKDLSDIIQQLENLTNEERIQLNLHKNILNVTALHLEALEENQERTKNAILTLDSNVRAINLTIQAQQESLYTLDNSVRMISALSYAASAMNDLDYIYTRFSQGISKMTRGVLSPEILPPDKLVKILDQFDKIGLRALWPSNDKFIPLYYKFATVLPVKTDVFMFYILIPLFPTPNTGMSLYKVTQLPYPFKSNVTISYGNLPPFFAVSDDHSLHTDLTNEDLTNCRQLNSLYYCNEVRPLYKSSHPSCTFSLYTNIGIDKFCAKHASPNLLRPIVIRDKDRWLYATSYNVHITIVCPSKTTTIELEIGVGSIEIPQNCRINSPFAQLPKAQEIQKVGMEIVNFTLVRPFNISLSNQEHELISIFNDSLYQDILALTGTPVPLHSLSAEIGQLRTIQKHRLRTAVQSTYAFIISVIVIIIIGCIVLCVCYVRKVLRENRDRTGRPVSRNPIINFLTDTRVYRPLPMENTSPMENRHDREHSQSSTHTTISYTPAVDPASEPEVHVIQPSNRNPGYVRVGEHHQ